MPYVPGFLPSSSAPLFHNGPWPPGLDLKLSVAGLPAVSIDVTNMGLCGGMSFLARDIFESASPQLRSTDPRSIPIATGEHVFRRLIDSFLGPEVIEHWLHATAALDQSTWLLGRGLFAETVEASHEVMRWVDAGGLVPIGVVLAQSPWPWDVFQNHVELVYGYDLDGSQLTLHTYDCNAEGSDRITISLDISASAPVRPITTTGTDMVGRSGLVRGFFVLPYEYVDPAPAYVDDASVRIADVPETMAPAASAAVEVTVENTGSTTLDPARGYWLGTQSPEDNNAWGTTRFVLSSPVDPGRSVTETVVVTAPPGPGEVELQLQAVRQPHQWFGNPSQVARVTVVA